MDKLQNPRIFVVAVLTIAVAGCGGGSVSSGGVGSISGRVSDLIALPIAGRADGDAIRISVEGGSSSAITNPDGTFKINGVPAGLQTVVARTPTHAAAFCARVAAGRDTHVGEIALREAGQISGLVTSQSDNTPVPAARVTVTELIYTNGADIVPHPVRVARTSASGSYTVDGLPAGEYLVNVDKEGFEPESLVTYVAPYSTTPGDIRLHPVDPASKGVMRGTAYLISDDGATSPIAGVLVKLAPLDQPPPPPITPLPEMGIDQNGAPVNLYAAAAGRSHSYQERYTYTDESGGYILDGIPAGEYIAIAVRHGLEADQKQVTIPASGTATVDFQLQSRPARAGVIEGRVVNAESGEPIANAGVSLFHGPVPMPIVLPEPITGGGYTPPGSVGGGSDGNVGGGSGGIYIAPDEYDFYVTTGPDGRFRMRAPVGETVINVYAEGYLPAEQTVVVPLNGSVAVEVKLTKRIVREVTLTGKVSTSTASGSVVPVADATVYASPISDDVHVMSASNAGSAVVTGGSRMHPYIVHSAVTDSEGRYTLKLETGSYYVYAGKDPLYSEPVRLDVNDDITHDFRLIEYPSVEPGP